MVVALAFVMGCAGPASGPVSTATDAPEQLAEEEACVDPDLLVVDSDDDGDGQPDYREITRRDDRGRVVEEGWFFFLEGPEARVRLVESYHAFNVFDATGTRSELNWTHHVDELGCGPGDWGGIETFTYNEQGNTLTETRNGRPWRTWAYEEAADGRLVTMEEDGNQDGTYDIHQVLRYDAAGRIVSDEAVRDHYDDWLKTYTYDDDGNLVAAMEYRDAGSSWRRRVEYSWTRDEHGNVLAYRTVHDDMDDGVVDYEVTEVYQLTYDDDGNVLTEVHETQYEGGALLPIDTRIYEYEWHADGVLARKSMLTDKGSTGTFETETIWTWDEAGELVSEEVDVGRNGRIDQSTNWSHPC
jgi:YD repeat-containing protein